jgi:hypothetical protein
MNVNHIGQAIACYIGQKCIVEGCLNDSGWLGGFGRQIKRAVPPTATPSASLGHIFAA